MWLIVRSLAYARNDKSWLPGRKRKRNCVQYAIATTSGCFMSVLLAVVTADWSELVLKDFREDCFATDID
ncbi:hypothetical protein BDV33DRAFT_188352 [Aspergillus novoparasiticus]|uniref:Uncharacterized protein n=1 Tax=Aspergillus novoparasiticus TaxID=986946 RepID=A0A5N6F6M2_9EURO|nr:hypothetical protein BDV33DRAFT_188352 [Aspergillus novoparasiticus]